MSGAAGRFFVSVAAYCDPLMAFTVEGALAAAAEPGRVVFGVVDQSPDDTALRALAARHPGQVRTLHLHPQDARGPCFARANARALWHGERWFLQVDSHTFFEPGWDERLRHWGRWAEALNPRFIASTYPNPFVLEGGVARVQPVTQGVLALVVHGTSRFAQDAADPVLAFEGVPVASEVPVPGFHVAAGALFAPGRIVGELPYDPHGYFHGEEQALALRAFTHGWDLWHLPAMPLAHLYVRGDEARPLHWSAPHDAARAQGWQALDGFARARLAALAGPDGGVAAGLGCYALGRERTLAEFAAVSGIDYARRTIEPRARKARYGYGVEG
jgi:hypothetical protein